MQLTYSLLSWSAWSPLKTNIEDWLQTPTLPLGPIDDSSSPALTQVPAMQRRRYSRLTKMMLSVAFDVQVAEQTRSIFSSRHGELNRTIDLLENVIANEPVSPIGFSQSVHNTASGIFTILTHNHAPSNSIAAGEQTLPQAMIEAFALLAEDPQPILFVYGDDPVPAVYSPYVDEQELPLAFAWQLAPASTASRLKLYLSDQIPADAQTIGFEHLLHAIASQQPISGILSHWYWELSCVE